MSLYEKLLPYETLDLCINCIGVLSEAEGRNPERRIEDADPAVVLKTFETNTLVTMMLAKHLKPLFRRSEVPKIHLFVRSSRKYWG